MEKYFFAADLGATSGRTIVGHLSQNKVEIEELTRFDNHLIETCGHVYWDIFALYHEIVRGLSEAARRHIDIASIGIDTWGVDFAFVGRDGGVLRNPMAYRDPCTFQAMDDYLSHVLPRDEVYRITGIQFINFNSLFQLHAMQREGNSALQAAETILFVPDCLSYMLTGQKVCEYSIASTSQLLDAEKRELSEPLLRSVGLERSRFGRMVAPGTPIGTLTPEVQRLTGLGPVPVVAVAGHDTASAVAAVPAANADFAYLSSGTWSLMGVESPQPVISAESYAANFTNEGGVEGTIRLLKNICGMWLYERCRSEWPEVKGMSHLELQTKAVAEAPFRSLIDPDDPAFANPRSMTEAIAAYCREHGEPVPEGPAQTCRCIFDSLALRYREVFTTLQTLTTVKMKVLHIIGGGSKNPFLNQFTANSLGVRVLAGPQEATALGNIMLQAKAAGEVSDIWDMRRRIAAGVQLQSYEPEHREEWDAAYQKYLSIVRGRG